MCDSREVPPKQHVRSEEERMVDRRNQGGCYGWCAMDWAEPSQQEEERNVINIRPGKSRVIQLGVYSGFVKLVWG